MLIKDILWLWFISFLPFVELRLAIPIGILQMGLPWPLVFIICVIADIILGILLIHFLGWINKLLTQWEFTRKYYVRTRDKTHKRMRHFTKKYGLLGVALFIAIPLPGSGVYTGTLGAFLIGLEKKRYYVALAIGVVFASIIVTFLTVSGQAIFS